jgi:hypothetical protein
VSYTLLRVVPEGVLLYEEHRARLAPAGAHIVAQFERFASAASPGVYALRADGDQLAIEPRAGSRLFDGMPVRFAPSPFAGRHASFPKPPSPSPYDAVRVPGWTTLLTSADGEEVFESCAAAVVAWDGTRLVLVPDDRPRVQSTAEHALRAGIACAVAPLLRQDRAPLALVNAVAGLCVPAVEGRPAFPAIAREHIDAVFTASIQRP